MTHEEGTRGTVAVLWKWQVSNWEIDLLPNIALTDKSGLVNIVNIYTYYLLVQGRTERRFPLVPLYPYP